MIKKLLAFVTALITLSAQPLEVTEFSMEYAPAGVNPHKGWALYINSEWDYINEEYGVGCSEVWNESDLIYMRVAWTSVLSDEGVYDWSIIDAHLEKAKNLGKSFAFGVIPSNSLVDNVNGDVPELVYEDGCDHVMAKTEHGYQRTPEWDDRVYLKHAKALVDALAERYDGDSDVEYIDIRTFGNWGEWHTYGLEGSEMPSERVQKELLKYWADAFEYTQLVLPVNDDRPNAVSEYAVTLGITLRRDGLMQLVGHEKALKPAAEARLPTVGEFCSSYTYMSENGMWSDDYMREIIRTAQLTYLQMGDGVQEGAYMWKEVPEFMAEINEMLGYNFTVTAASIAQSGDIYTLTVTIDNRGVAPQYFPLYLRAGTGMGGAVWAIGEAVLIPEGEFGGGTSRTYTLSFPTAELKDTLYLGAFEEGLAQPTVSFANKGVNKQRWLELGKV